MSLDIQAQANTETQPSLKPVLRIFYSVAVVISLTLIACNAMLPPTSVSNRYFAQQ